MAPAHQNQPPSVKAATIKPAASRISVTASPSRHHRGKAELTLSGYLGQAPQVSRNNAWLSGLQRFDYFRQFPASNYSGSITALEAFGADGRFASRRHATFLALSA